MSIPKRHHYLPKFYLEGFSDGGSLCVYDRESNEFRNQTPINTAVQTHLYTLVDNNGSNNLTIERILSQIEGFTASVIKKIDSGDELSEEDQLVLSVFGALLKFRVPEYKRQQLEIYKAMGDQLKDIMDNLSLIDQADHSKPIPPLEEERTYNATEVLDSLEEMEKDPEAAHRNFLEMIIPMTREISKLLMQMDWIIGHPTSPSGFITSDNPFLLVPPSDYDPHGYLGAGILTPGARKVIPLSTTSCILMLDYGTSTVHRDFSSAEVRSFNLNTAINSDRFIIGSNEKQLRNIVRDTGLDRYKTRPRVEVS